MERGVKNSRFPFKLLNVSLSEFRAALFPSVPGTEPDNELLVNSRKDSFDKFPREGGIGPVSKLSPRCKYESSRIRPSSFALDNEASSLLQYSPS